MSSSQTKKHPNWKTKYRCLSCNAQLKFKTTFLRQPIELVVCPLCGIKYDINTLLDADPDTWERVRLRNLYELKENEAHGTILRHSGLGHF